MVHKPIIQGERRRYPWGEMGIGDTFYTGEEIAKPSASQAVTNANNRWLGKRKFATAKGWVIRIK